MLQEPIRTLPPFTVTKSLWPSRAESEKIVNLPVASACVLDTMSSSEARRRVSIERANRGALFNSQHVAEILVDTLRCPICLDVTMLPVSLICFPGCSGTRSRGNP